MKPWKIIALFLAVVIVAKGGPALVEYIDANIANWTEQAIGAVLAAIGVG